MTTEPLLISARTNPLLVSLRKLSRDGAAYRRQGLVWLEGDHLCSAAAQRGVVVRQAVMREAAWRQPQRRELARHAARIVLLPDALFADISGLESPADMGFVIDLPAAAVPESRLDTVVLDRVQDAGNVGSILRSAAALGARQVLAIKGTAALWSPKVLRAGMGAHFKLIIVERADLPAVARSFHGQVLATCMDGDSLYQCDLRGPLALMVGNEGAGLSAALIAAASRRVTIPMPGGMESLNAAIATAVCLFERVRQNSA